MKVVSALKDFDRSGGISEMFVTEIFLGWQCGVGDVVSHSSATGFEPKNFEEI